MEAFGIMGMAFGLMAWLQLQSVSKELTELEKVLKESGVLENETEVS